MQQITSHTPTPSTRPPGISGIYLASRFARQAEMREVAEDLCADGYRVTSRWLSSPAALTKSDLEDGSAASFAMMDLDDLRRSDACIAFTEPVDADARGRGGRHVELGIAVGLDLPVLIVGPREHVFHALPSIHWAPNWADARRQLVEGLLEEAQSIRVSRGSR